MPLSASDPALDAAERQLQADEAATASTPGPRPRGRRSGTGGSPRSSRSGTSPSEPSPGAPATAGVPSTTPGGTPDDQGGSAVTNPMDAAFGVMAEAFRQEQEQRDAEAKAAADRRFVLSKLAEREGMTVVDPAAPAADPAPVAGEAVAPGTPAPVAATPGAVPTVAVPATAGAPVLDPSIPGGTGVREVGAIPSGAVQEPGNGSAETEKKRTYEFWRMPNGDVVIKGTSKGSKIVYAPKSDWDTGHTKVFKMVFPPRLGALGKKVGGK